MGISAKFAVPEYDVPKKVLTIAGSDSGGAAGLQADLRTWALLGLYGMSVVTAVTAQNSLAVNAVQFMPAEFVATQLDAVLSDYGADAAKTGFLGRVEIIEVVAEKLAVHAVPHLVIDPVLVNHRGEPLFPTAVMQAIIDHLLPLAELVTPNLVEAGLLAGLTVENVADGETAVRHIHALGPQNVLLKRIPDGNNLVDLFFDGTTITRLSTTKVETINTHGSGDILSAAICAFLAQDMEVATAVSRARQFTVQAIQHSASWQMGSGHGPVFPVIGNW
jgi:hydroxymethylpyrimidine/phosphomethylpyrimidine kinase